MAQHQSTTGLTTRRTLTNTTLLIVAVLLAACASAFVTACADTESGAIDVLNVGTSYESDDAVFAESVSGYGVQNQFVKAAIAGEEADGRTVFATVLVEKEVVVEKAVVREVEAASDSDNAKMVVEMEAAEELSENVDVSFQPQNRIIVRNADMVVESDDPPAMVETVSGIAVSSGGWVVNSNSTDLGFHNITIRVPADRLDRVIDQVSALASKVEAITSDSTDFTEEYIDLGARRKTVQETVDALITLLQKEDYKSVQELLEVQREITNWQSELERIDGRMSFISESAAYSRLTVTVNRSPIPMRVDVGEDVNVGIGVGRKYTARFFPPEGYDRFEIEWDFGDGSPTQTVQSGLRTQDEDGYLSVPVRHYYETDEFSPHVVTVTVKAYSDRGLAEGEDQLWATVSELPRIDAFVDASNWDPEEGTEVIFTASFNHPETLRNVNYEWDFRDGSGVVKGTVPAGETGIETAHVFERNRPAPYQVRFEISGDSDAGEVEETLETYIHVRPAPSVEGAEFNPGGTATNAFNVLIGVVALAGTAAIWIGVTSPIWLILGGALFFLIRFLKRRDRKQQRTVRIPRPQNQKEEAATSSEPESND